MNSKVTLVIKVIFVVLNMLKYEKLLTLISVCAFGLSTVQAQENLGYQMPPASIAELVDAPMVPKIDINEEQTWMLVLHAPRFVDMDLAANPMVGLGGLRINPNTHTLEAELHGFFTEVEVTDLKSQAVVTLTGLPVDLKMSDIQWHPLGHGFAFTHQVDRGLELWYADLASRQARKLTHHRLNALTGTMLQWHPSGQYILVQVPANDGTDAPAKPRIPHGPVIQENLGTRSPSRTFSSRAHTRTPARTIWDVCGLALQSGWVRGPKSA